MPSSKTGLVLPDTHPVLGSTAVFQSFNYAPAVAAGGLLFVAGQIGLRADGSVPESAEEQADWAFRRLGAILEAAGADFEDLVELGSATTWTSMRNWPAFAPSRTATSARTLPPGPSWAWLRWHARRCWWRSRPSPCSARPGDNRGFSGPRASPGQPIISASLSKNAVAFVLDPVGLCSSAITANC